MRKIWKRKTLVSRERILPGAAPEPAGRSPSGLTLIEVLLALFILGTGLAVIMQGLALGLKIRRESTESQQLSLVALNRLNVLMSEGKVSPDMEEGAEGDFRWRIESSPSEGDAGRGTETVLAHVRILVEAPSGRTWELSTIMPQDDDEP
jgi:prepilin-type N-terminal cleavage/methylation domain-containing protein